MKIGLVGGYGHESVAHFPGAELAWACDDYDHQAIRRAEAYGCTNLFPSMEAMLEAFQPDVVYIGTVYAQNGPLAIRALKRGFDVVCEKPLACKWDDLAELARLTQSGKSRIIAEFAMRWHPAFQTARELIHEGKIGQVVLIQAQKTYRFGSNRPEFYKSRELFGGIIGWVAVHAIDFAAWCSGLYYEAVTAVQGNRSILSYAGMEDHAAMLFTMTDHVPCLIASDFLKPAWPTSRPLSPLRVTGSQGVIEIHGNEVIWSNHQSEQSWNCTPSATAASELAQDLVLAAMGASSRKISTQESLDITAACLAAQSAAQTGQKVACRQCPGFGAVSVGAMGQS